jgi:hypothetical protein
VRRYPAPRNIIISSFHLGSAGIDPAAFPLAFFSAAVPMTVGF